MKFDLAPEIIIGSYHLPHEGHTANWVSILNIPCVNKIDYVLKPQDSYLYKVALKFGITPIGEGKNWKLMMYYLL